MFSETEYSLERDNVRLHLDSINCEMSEFGKNILLVHGVTYSSHEFDIDYEDYSLARFLARNGYTVWRLDIAGFGRSGAVESGFIPDSHYAAEDICCAVLKICELTGNSKIDILGWSWGTVTSSIFAAKHSGMIDKLILYAPIASGIGKLDITDEYHHNFWEHAASDFQKDDFGDTDREITDPIVEHIFCSRCWKYDGDCSPNGGRRDICVSEETTLIDFSSIRNPTLVICGDNDPYLNLDRIRSALHFLPSGSETEIISGAAHCAFIEKPFHKEFQQKVLEFLNK